MNNLDKKLESELEKSLSSRNSLLHTPQEPIGIQDGVSAVVKNKSVVKGSAKK